MFGLFKKKSASGQIKDQLTEKVKKVKSNKNDPTQNPDFLELVTKWESFLAKIENRFNESLVNAENALLDNLEESNFDLTPTLTAWQGIKSNLQGLSTKIDETFDEKVSPQMLEYIDRSDLIDQNQKGTVLSESIYERIERYEIILEGKVCQRFYDHAIHLLNHDFTCSQCSGKLDVRKDIFRMNYVSCDYCNTVNTFTPSDKIIQIRWVVDNIAKHKVIEDWDTMKKAQDDFHEIRCPHEDQDKTEYTAGFKKREDTERNFWGKYFTERAKYLPEYEETIAHDTDVKMRWFYEERKRELNF